MLQIGMELLSLLAQSKLTTEVALVKVPGSNLDRIMTIRPEVLVIFLSCSGQMPGYNLKFVLDRGFLRLFQLIIHYHQIVQHYIVSRL
jgi:hypothetical protein